MILVIDGLLFTLFGGLRSAVPQGEGQFGMTDYFVPEIRSTTCRHRTPDPGDLYRDVRELPFRVSTTELTRSPWRTPYMRAVALQTPPDRSPQALSRYSMLPPASCKTSASDSIDYRGSITRLTRALCTLRGANRPTPRNTRFRLVASLCRTGLSPVRFASGGF